MLSSILFYTLICFFSIYGFVQLVFYIMDFIYDSKIFKDKTIYTVVAVKNEEKTVEGIAKALLWKALRNDTGVADSKLIIVDAGSCDETLKILYDLERQNKGIQYFSKGDFIDYIEKDL